MRLTRRGWGVLVVVVSAFLAAVGFGPRGLNALVAPGLILLTAGVLSVLRYDPPPLLRELPERGTRGEAVTVRLELAADVPFSARIHDNVGLGLSASGNHYDVTVDDTTLTYELRLEQRGEQFVGPLTVETRDVFGLVTRTFDYAGRGSILVRPPVYPLLGPRREVLVALYGIAGDDRQEFDQLRDYRRGDPLRDVHWRSSAKLPTENLLVKQFSAHEASRTVEIAAGATRRHADEMAEAAASIAAHLLEAGLEVGLSTPSGRLAPDDGADHLGALLDHLAVVETGQPTQTTGADIAIQATADGVEVDMSGRRCTFASLAGAGLNAPRGAGQMTVAAAHGGMTA